MEVQESESVTERFKGRLFVATSLESIKAPWAKDPKREAAASRICDYVSATIGAGELDYEKVAVWVVHTLATKFGWDNERILSENLIDIAAKVVPPEFKSRNPEDALRRFTLANREAWARAEEGTGVAAQDASEPTYPLPHSREQLDALLQANQEMLGYWRERRGPYVRDYMHLLFHYEAICRGAPNPIYQRRWEELTWSPPKGQRDKRLPRPDYWFTRSHAVIPYLEESALEECLDRLRKYREFAIMQRGMGVPDIPPAVESAINDLIAVSERLRRRILAAMEKIVSDGFEADMAVANDAASIAADTTNAVSGEQTVDHSLDPAFKVPARYRTAPLTKARAAVLLGCKLKKGHNQWIDRKPEYVCDKVGGQFVFDIRIFPREAWPEVMTLPMRKRFEAEGSAFKL